MKFINKKFGLLIALLLGSVVSAQELKTTNDTVAKLKSNKKIDGVIAVVGDYVILDSDIDKGYLEIQSRSRDGVIPNIKRCEMLGKLLEDKLYAHHAIQDSIPVNDAEIKSIMNNQIDYLIENLGSMNEVVKYFKKKDEEEFKTDLFEILKVNKLTEEMRKKIVDEVEITPEEVRTFFNKIPKDSLPVFGVELEVSQIVIDPVISSEEKQKVIKRLNEFRKDILENNGSFFSKAVLYSEDPGTKSNGGAIKVTRKSPLVKEFKDMAFSLEEGQISEPFETMFGYHIIYVEKVRGQERDIRHILLKPRVTEEAMREARDKALRIRSKILAGEISFADAARSESDEKETKANGGVLINPQTQDTRFELTKMDPKFYSQISSLKDNEISMPLIEETATGKRYKILTVSNRYDEHVADYAKDYIKIKEMALREKQFDVIRKWTKEKISETFIKIEGEYKDCSFENNWLKKN